MRQTIATSAIAWGTVMALSFGALGCGILACARKAPAADVAAELDGKSIPYAEFEAYLAANAIVEAPSLDSEVLSSLFDQFLEELLLTHLASDEGIEEGGARLAVVRLITQSSAPVDPGEVEAFYRANPERFLQAESVRLRQILVEERATAEQATRELAAGEPFEGVAQRLSQGPRAENGGDQGVLTREDLPPEIASRIFALGSGDVSEVIAAEYGFHIFQISERYPETQTPLVAAVPEILELLEDRRRGETARALLERAVTRYNMHLYERNLPFQYLGKYG